MDLDNIEKLFVSASNLQKRADKMQQSILKEYGVEWYEDIKDDFARDLCDRLNTLSGSIEYFREFAEENGL